MITQMFVAQLVDRIIAQLLAQRYVECAIAQMNMACAAQTSVNRKDMAQLKVARNCVAHETRAASQDSREFSAFLP